MLTRIKPEGWPYGTTVSAAEMNALDIQHTHPLDGVSGGTYSPTTLIELGDLSPSPSGGGIYIENGLNVLFTGRLEGDSSYSFGWRTMPWLVALDTISTEWDEYRCNETAPYQNYVLRLNAVSGGGYKMPLLGERIRVVHCAHAGGPHTVLVYNAPLGPATLLATLTSDPTYIRWAECTFDGANWVVSAQMVG